MTPTLREAAPSDAEAFLEMWAAFVTTDPDEPGNPALGAVNWARIVDPSNPMCCLIATDTEGTPAGFLIYLAFPFTWSAGDVCYLLDLFVRADLRGQRIAEAMIRHLEAIGREKGWFKIFWMTQAHNAPAQRLYDRLALRRDHIRYDLPLSDP